MRCQTCKYWGEPAEGGSVARCSYLDTLKLPFWLKDEDSEHPYERHTVYNEGFDCQTYTKKLEEPYIP